MNTAAVSSLLEAINEAGLVGSNCGGRFLGTWEQVLSEGLMTSAYFGTADNVLLPKGLYIAIFWCKTWALPKQAKYADDILFGAFNTTDDPDERVYIYKID